MSKRTYTIPVTLEITVDSEVKTVDLAVDIMGVPTDLRYDYDHCYPDPLTEEHEQIIHDCIMQSPSNFFITHHMSAE